MQLNRMGNAINAMHHDVNLLQPIVLHRGVSIEKHRSLALH